MFMRLIVLAILVHSAHLDSDAKRTFKKLFAQQYLQRRDKKVDLTSIIRNISDSKLIDDIALKLTEKVVSRLRKRMERNANEDLRQSTEQIDVMLGAGSLEYVSQNRVNGKIYVK